MRLAVLERGHRRRARLFVALARRLGGGEDVDDVFKTILYRPRLFGGAAWPGLIRAALRGPSEWSVGERELFAAGTSRANRCEFCTDIHCATASLALGRTVTEAELAAHDEAVLRPQARALLELVERLTRDPDAVTRADVEAVRRAGVSDEAIGDGLAICFAFNLVNRLADAFGYSWESEAQRRAGARALVRFGYRVPGFLVR